MDFLQVDVFGRGPYSGNPLAVFPDAADLSTEQMQAIASEMNLSETTFVTGIENESYEVRIFTPREELRFAGHPTNGTAWVLRHLGRIQGDSVTQRSGAGETPVTFSDDMVHFERSGSVSPDIEANDVRAHEKVARALNLEERDVSMEAYELGRSGMLRPALADAGLEHFLVPLRDVGALGRVRIDLRLISELSPIGAYCFTAVKAGVVRARGLFPEYGIEEDPATGSAAAALGVYLADRIGPIELRIEQGQEIDRPSEIRVSAGADRVKVGGRCELVLTGRLETLP